MKQKMIDFLLNNANPSIKLRVRKQCGVTFRALLIGHYSGVL